MGVYVYKISSKPCMTHEGRPVYKASYAYKPYWAAHDAEKVNQRFDFQTGVVSCQRYWNRKSEAERTNVLVLNYNRIYELAYCTGSVYDGAFDKKPLAEIAP